MSEHTVRVPSTSGIYKLSCIPNKRIYIGSAINLQSRKRQHFHELRRNRHCNRHLQRAWNKYGEAAFSFEVLEIVLPISLTAREQYWINLLKPFGRKGFNIAHEAGSHLGIKYSPATKEKMSIQRRANKQKPEFIEKRVAPLRGRKYKTGRKHTAEHRAKIEQAQLGRKMSPDAVEKS